MAEGESSMDWQNICLDAGIILGCIATIIAIARSAANRDPYHEQVGQITAESKEEDLEQLLATGANSAKK